MVLYYFCIWLSIVFNKGSNGFYKVVYGYENLHVFIIV
jgi:hypothetical protein